jgi:hypothetical protein
MRSDTSLSITAREVLAYLNEHPDAQDTLDGITQWWLLQGRSKNRVDVEKALGELVRQGMVMEIKVQGSPSIYRLARRKKGS